MSSRAPYCAAIALLLASCAADTTSTERFAATGELIAMSGAGAGAANACFTCHGLDGAGDGSGVPRLAGLDPGYLAAQMEAYADGRRHHTQMSWISRQLGDRERVAVSAYYSGLPFSLPPPKVAKRNVLFHNGDPARGLPACATCHGESGEGVGSGIPSLAGQPAPYLAEQIELWRKARRRTDAGGEMLRISQLLTPSESRRLALYSSRLTGAPDRPALPAGSHAGRRADPRSGASMLPLHVPESARTAE